MKVVRIIGIVWAVALVGTLLFSPLWVLLILSAFALVLGLIGVTFRSLENLPWGLEGSGGVLLAAALALQSNPDPLAKTFHTYCGGLGAAICISGSIAVVICNNLMKTEWGRRHEGRPTVQELVAIIQDPASDERAVAVLELSYDNYQRDLQALSTIIWATRDADPAVHDMAMLALLDRDGPPGGSIHKAVTAAGEPRHIAAADLRLTPLEDRIDLLLIHANPHRRSAVYTYALQALTELGPLALPVLLKDLEPQDAGRLITSLNRRAAAHVLGQFGELAEDAVPALIRALDDPDREAREEIIRALGYIGDTQATAPLIERLHDADPYVRMAAAEALGVLGDTSMLPVLQEIQQNDIYAQGRQKRLLLEVAEEAIMNIQAQAQESVNLSPTDHQE